MKNFFLMILLYERNCYIMFFEDLDNVIFSDESFNENLKKSPRKHPQGGKILLSLKHGNFI